MLVERGVVRIGVEIEVAAWKRRFSSDMVVSELLKDGFMEGSEEDWAEIHTYRCTCRFCGRVRSGVVFYDPLVSYTYDASLPDTGAEFVTSPIVLADDGLNAIRPIWDIIASKAVWRDDLENRRGDGMASPSIHLHVSATRPFDSIADNDRAEHIDDIMHMLSLYAPEFILLASLTDHKRGLTFRQPLRFPSHRGHHGFIHVRESNLQMVYIEWRIFEADYENWNYLERAAFLSATLTRSLLSFENYRMLMTAGYENAYDLLVIETAVREDDLDAVLQQVSRERMSVLRRLCLAEIDDDNYGTAILQDLFVDAERMI